MLSLQSHRFLNSLLPVQTRQASPTQQPMVQSPEVHAHNFDTNFSRDPARIRAVFDDVVERTKAMNLDKPKTSKAKKLATLRGLNVNIEQARELHWRSIQAREPVVLTASLNSPPRTPRRPAMNYPSATSSLYLIKESEAKGRQNYNEARHWKECADRERAINLWEKSQSSARQAKAQPLGPRKRHTKSSSNMRQNQPPSVNNAGDLDALRRSAEALQALFDEANRSALTSLEDNAKHISSAQNISSTQPNALMLQPEMHAELARRLQGSTQPYVQEFHPRYMSGHQQEPMMFDSSSVAPLPRTNATLDLPQLHQPIPKLALKMAPVAMRPQIEANLDYSGLLSSEAYFGQTTEAFEKPPQFNRQDSTQSTTSSIITMDGGMTSDFSTGSSSSLGPLTPTELDSGAPLYFTPNDRGKKRQIEDESTFPALKRRVSSI